MRSLRRGASTRSSRARGKRWTPVLFVGTAAAVGSVLLLTNVRVALDLRQGPERNVKSFSDWVTTTKSSEVGGGRIRGREGGGKTAAQLSETKCGLYLAESSIPNAGLGMYTGVDVPLGSTIGPSGIVIQHYDHEMHQELRRLVHGINKADEADWPLTEYYWESRTARGRYDARKTQSYIPGVGMLANSHPGLVNTLFRRPEIDAAGLHRSRDAGTGAFSEFHNYQYVARHSKDGDGDGPGLVRGKIPKGMEVFAAYGDGWFRYREKTMGPIPLSRDFLKVDGLMDRFARLVNQTINETDWPGALNELWNSTLGRFSPRDKRLHLALPDTGEIALRARETFGPGAAAMLTVPNVVRSIEWLEENGSCIDNIKAGRSTVKQAGRGAFATRNIRAGEIVAPAPVVHILRDHLHMYRSEGGNVRRRAALNRSEIVHTGEQLMLNYCYGHPESSLLLFPSSPVVHFINHNGKRPNVYLRWSSLGNHHAEWLNRTVQSIMAEEGHAGLIMEFVALHDIHEGEEIFVDGGRLWEKAWSEHVEKWQPVKNATSYLSAAMLNEGQVHVRTEEEQKSMPYPDNVKVMCYGLTIGSGNSSWQDSPWLMQYADRARPCTILRRYNEESNKTGLTEDSGPPRILYEVSEVRRAIGRVRVSGVTRDVPRKAIEFVDKEYTRDQFLENSFRHEMEVPKGLFPELWLDLKREKT